LLRAGLALALLAVLALGASPADAAGGRIRLVKDIRPGIAPSTPTELTDVNGALLFVADDGANGAELWKSNGTTAGTRLLKDVNPGAGAASSPHELVNVNGTLFFVADNGVHGNELWKSNGTTAGTRLLKDIMPGAASSWPRDLTNVGGTLYFVADNGANGLELWKSNGTTAGTKLVKDISARFGYGPRELTAVGGALFFRYEGQGASDWLLGGLWRSDGTTAGTVQVSLEIVPYGLAAVGKTLFFSATPGDGSYWLGRSDGTSLGTVLLKDFLWDAPRELTDRDGVLYFFAYDNAHMHSGLWRSDGTAAGTTQVAPLIQSDPDLPFPPHHLTNVNGTLFFVAPFVWNGGLKYSLWKSDGTNAVMVKDVWPTHDRVQLRDLTNVNGLLYFFNDDWPIAIDLFVSDGTAAGTVQLRRYFSYPAGETPPHGPVNVGGIVYYAASDGVTGRELWEITRPE